MMKKIILIITCFLTMSSLSAQKEKSAHDLKGKVVNAGTNTPVSYTNIGIEGTYFGTASDAEGNFELNIPAEFSDRQIFFSAVGFKNRKFPVSDLFGKDFNLIKLEAQTYSIEDIDVNAQSMVLYRILRTASENVPRNFVKGPFNMDCSYEYEKDTGNKKYTRTATVTIYDQTGYSTPGIEDAFKNRNYSFSNVKQNFESYTLSDGTTNLDEILGLDMARSVSSVLDPANQSQLSLSQEQDSEENGVDVWIIGFKLPKPNLQGSGDFYVTRFEGKIYINKNNYEVKKIEGWVKSEKQNPAGRGLAIGPKTKEFLKDVNYDFTVSYNSDGLDFISLNKYYKWEGNAVNEKTRLVVNAIKTTKVSAISSRDYFVGK